MQISLKICMTCLFQFLKYLIIYLHLSSGRFLLRKCLYTLNNKDDRQEDQKDSEDRLCPRTPVSAACGDHADLVLNCECKGGDRNDDHECHRDQEHPVSYTHLTLPTIA